MKSFRLTMLAICVILIASAFAGCGADTDLPDKRPALGKIEYTNLNDSGSRELLKELLSEIGVSDERVQGFFRRVDRFHDSVKQEWLTDGFEEAELLYTKYDPYAMQDEWTAKNGTFPGYNCRITAMSLFGDFLSVSADSQINAGEDVLFVDEETLKTDPDAQPCRFPRTVFLHEGGGYHGDQASCTSRTRGMGFPRRCLSGE